MIADGVMTSRRFYKMASLASQMYFRFLVWPCLTFKKAQSCWHTGTKIDQISHSAAEILLLPVPENKLPPYWNSTSGFHFYIFTVIGIWLCSGLPDFMQIGWWRTDMTSHRFYKMASTSSQIYFRFLVRPRVTFKKV